VTTPFVCVFVAFALIWLSRVPVVVAIARSDEDFDIRLPPRQLARLDGFGARAVAAHRGVRDGFAPFAAAVIIAHLAGADPRRCAVLAVAFVVAQALYVGAYLGNVDYLRAFVWLIGLLIVVGLFALALTGA
jgi:uncharacterized MAPEG superfamily protein